MSETEVIVTTTIENRATFFARLKPLLSAHDLLLVTIAYQLAKDYHRNQARKQLGDDGNPLRYFEHLRDVTLILIDEFNIIDVDIICAALLHDALEDTQLTIEMIEHIFNKEVARIVRCVTAIPKEGYVDRLAKFGDWKVLVVKLADNLHNCRTMHHGTEAWQAKQVIKRLTKYNALWARLDKLHFEIEKIHPGIMASILGATSDCNTILQKKKDELGVQLPSPHVN